MTYGNEPGGNNQVPFLTGFVNFWKSKNSRRIYTSGSGWPILDVNDYLSTSDPRIQAWGQELKSVINGEAPRTDYDWSAFNSKYRQPVVSHEIGQWCVYPNFKEIAKYTGVLKRESTFRLIGLVCESFLNLSQHFSGSQKNRWLA